MVICLQIPITFLFKQVEEVLILIWNVNVSEVMLGT
jgi:hypothetical protein